MRSFYDFICEFNTVTEGYNHEKEESNNAFCFLHFRRGADFIRACRIGICLLRWQWLGGLGEGPRDPVFDVSRIYYDVHYGANGYEERDNADDEPTPPNLLDLFRLWFEAQGRPQR